jgi:hypothetical protein
MVSMLAPSTAPVAIINTVFPSCTTKGVKVRYSSWQTGRHSSLQTDQRRSSAASLHAVTQMIGREEGLTNVA